MPTVSVIVPVYKVEPYLHRCVDSILAQTFKDFELILVDDGSPDSCGAICDEYAAKDERIHVIHQENQGQAAARNHALDWVFINSKSEYISFVDSDDWIHSRYLELLVEGIRRYNVNICQCGYFETESSNPESSNQIIVNSYSFSLLTPEEQYIYHYSSFMWDKLFSKTCWSDNRFPEGQIYEDLAICYKMLFAQKQIAMVEAGLYYYRYNPESTMHQDWHPKMLARMDAWDAQIDFFNQRGDKDLINIAITRYCRVASYEYSAIEESTRLTEAEKKENQAVLARRFRKLMLKNFREVKNDTYYLWLRAIAFPKYDWCYWMVRSIPNRVKRLLNRK